MHIQNATYLRKVRSFVTQTYPEDAQAAVGSLPAEAQAAIAAIPQ